jgi:multidrug resistance efflux pump
VLFSIDSQPFEFEVNRLKASLAATEQGVPELQQALNQATAARRRAEAQTALAQQVQGVGTSPPSRVI